MPGRAENHSDEVIDVTRVRAAARALLIIIILDDIDSISYDCQPTPGGSAEGV